MRNSLVVDFANRSSLPDSIVLWNREAENGEMLRSCGDSTFGACTNFIPFEAVWDYGCFCQFGVDAGNGKGTPQNEVDELCRALTYCYRCVRIGWFENSVFSTKYKNTQFFHFQQDISVLNRDFSRFSLKIKFFKSSLRHRLFGRHGTVRP